MAKQKINTPTTADQSKEHIMEIAMELFAKNGYHKTSSQAISKKAGISNGLIFYHFQTKEGVLKASIDLVLGKLDKILDVQDETLSPRDHLEMIIDRFFDSMKNERMLWDFYMSILYQPDTKEIILPQVTNSSKKFRRRIYTLLKEMGNKDPGMESFKFEVFRVGIFSTYLSMHRDDLLEKAVNILKERFLENREQT